MYAANIDSNQPEIVAALRARGWSVEHLHRNGSGVPDLLVGAGERNILLEIIGPEKLKKYRATDGLNELQVKWHGGWSGQRATVHTIAEAVAAVLDGLSGILVGDHVFQYIYGSDGSTCGRCSQQRGVHSRVPGAPGP